MKIRISKLYLDVGIRYVVKSKKHWWSKWHYLMNGRYPRLFTIEELKEMKLFESAPFMTIKDLLSSFSDDELKVVIKDYTTSEILGVWWISDWRRPRVYDNSYYLENFKVKSWYIENNGSIVIYISACN